MIMNKTIYFAAKTLIILALLWPFTFGCITQGATPYMGLIEIVLHAPVSGYVYMFLCLLVGVLLCINEASKVPAKHQNNSLPMKDNPGIRMLKIVGWGIVVLIGLSLLVMLCVALYYAMQVPGILVALLFGGAFVMCAWHGVEYFIEYKRKIDRMMSDFEKNEQNNQNSQHDKK